MGRTGITFCIRYTNIFLQRRLVGLERGTFTIVHDISPLYDYRTIGYA